MEYRRSFSMSRSERILLSSESVTLECAKIAGYERISQSMKFDEEDEHKKNKKGIGFLSKILTLTKTSTTHEGNEVAEKEKKEKKRSSWLPDPDKRWPIQGCLEEGAEDFIVKPVKLSDVKRLKGYMTTRDVRGEIENREINVNFNGNVEGNNGVGINNKRKLEEASDEFSSEPSISSSPSVSLSSSPMSSSPDVLDSPIRRLKMADTE